MWMIKTIGNPAPVPTHMPRTIYKEHIRPRVSSDLGHTPDSAPILQSYAFDPRSENEPHPAASKALCELREHDMASCLKCRDGWNTHHRHTSNTLWVQPRYPYRDNTRTQTTYNARILIKSTSLCLSTRFKKDFGGNVNLTGGTPLVLDFWMARMFLFLLACSARYGL